MAHFTSEQAEAFRTLTVEFRMPTDVRFEVTAEPYGLLWLRWKLREEVGTVVLGDRNLFVRPDGTRLTWEMRL